MNPQRWNNQGLGVGFTTLLLLLIVASIAPDWLVNGALILILLAIVSPIVGIFVFRWWLERNLVVSSCPVCGASVQGVTGIATQCSNCGADIVAQNGQYERVSPPGTVDVEVEVIDASHESILPEVLPPED